MKNYLEEKWVNYKKDLAKLIKIESFLITKDDYPNKEQKLAVMEMEKIAKDAGMKVYSDPDGFYGYIEIGQGTEMIGILGHIDVVGVGDLKMWKTNPFILREEDEILYGRGVSDNKGPLLLSFYLLKEILEKKVKLTKRIRLIYPTDEESFWRGIEKYKEKEQLPTIGWTPDSSFPPTYAEKAIFQYKLIFNERPKFEINGGNGANSVASKVTYSGRKNRELEDNLKKLGYEYKLNQNSIEVYGKTAHAMKSATEGVNAIQLLLKALNGIEDSPLITFADKYLKLDKTGKSLFGKNIADKESGIITNNLGLISSSKNGFELIFDSRVPIFETNYQKLEKRLIKVASKNNFEYELYDILDKFYMKKDGKFIQLLLNTYKDISNDKTAVPHVSGGGTYARAMENIVAFGPFVSDSPDTEHEENECARKKDLILAYNIYQVVLEKLLNDWN
ncbi:MAG: Sapep family Mn(2+)-dependent dipeptidase [Mycoplasmataceae bacterium]|nr:Sapep family Mn(2+)-dependent dipeptidase [Mycoplasmataceae bacterium]